MFLLHGELRRLLEATPPSPFLCGQQPTLPDFQLFYLLEHGRVLADLYDQPTLSFLNGNDQPVLVPFYDRMASRSSTRQVLASRKAEFEQMRTNYSTA